MSASDSDSDVSSRKPATVIETPVSLSLMSRRLQTFGSPDLEVAVGKRERIYHYHSLILASQSLYVDTLLSSPAAKREQEKWRITFPDIECETWEKMIKFLTPNVVHPTLDELMEIIPLYDKYQFHDGLRYCDSLLSTRIPLPTVYTMSFYDAKKIEELPHLLSMIWPLNFFPLSKPLAAQYASRCLRKFHNVDEETIRLLMPLVINDDDVIKSMVSTFLGRKCKGMTLNEMRDMIDRPDFPDKCISQCSLIKEIDAQRQCLQVAKLDICGCRAHMQVNGHYEFKKSSEFRREYGNEFAVSHAGGAMVGYWQKLEGRIGHSVVAREVIVVESLDVFGSLWEIYSAKPKISSDDESSIEEVCGSENRRVLLRWENAMLTSLIPPKRGWKIIDDSGNSVGGNELQIDYSIG